MAVIDRFEIGGVFYDVQDTAATDKNVQQDVEIGSLQTRVSAVEQEAKKPNGLFQKDLRTFVTETNPYTWTANHSGFLRVSAMKKVGGYSVRLRVNGQYRALETYWGTDATGTPLNFPIFSVTLTAWVEEGDQIVINSNEQGAPSTDSWYVANLNLQYVV